MAPNMATAPTHAQDNRGARLRVRSDWPIREFGDVAMEWLVVAGIAVVGITCWVFLERSRAKGEAELTPEERARKRALEDMADRLGPLP
jgi:hypothetical protein